ASGGNAIWFMRGSSLIASRSISSLNTSWTIRGTGDYNLDGYSDILWRSSTGANGIWCIVGATVVTVKTLPTVNTAWYITHDGDFNGDGRADIAWRSSSGANAIWFMGSSSLISKALPSMNTAWNVINNWNVGTSSLASTNEAESLSGNPITLDGSPVAFDNVANSETPELLAEEAAPQPSTETDTPPEGLNPVMSTSLPQDDQSNIVYLPIIISK
ncbi:MAG: VCBS repeat-containing protein, partial [Oscillochloris sp.]|nr:VCBS repeat-containing protein [Oscillochloris sp.]